MKISQHFNLEEFVPQDIFNQYGEKSIWFIDPRLINLAEFIRTFFNKPMTINGNGLNERGFRSPDSSTGAKLSQHKFGRAIDFNIQGLTPQQVYDTILKNKDAFMKAGLTTMEDIKMTPTWTHVDVRQTNKLDILIVQPA